MKWAVISDIHDRVDHLEMVLEQAEEMDCGGILCLGDMESPFTLNALLEMTETMPIEMVWGNNDFETTAFENIASQHPRLTIYGITAEIALSGIRVAMTHYPQMARNMAVTGEYDFVFYGHTHEASIIKINRCILANPGEVMGRKGTISFGILDTETRQFTLHKVLA